MDPSPVKAPVMPQNDPSLWTEISWPDNLMPGLTLEQHLRETCAFFSLTGIPEGPRLGAEQGHDLAVALLRRRSTSAPLLPEISLTPMSY